MTDIKTWSGFWFMNGGNLHGQWKRRQYKDIRDSVFPIAKAAWDQQQKKIEVLESHLKYALCSLEQASEMMDFDEDGEAEEMKRWCKEVRREFNLKGSI
jgi:hypothetical protein